MWLNPWVLRLTCYGEVGLLEDLYHQGHDVKEWIALRVSSLPSLLPNARIQQLFSVVNLSTTLLLP